MPNVTIAGAGGATVTLSFDSATNAALARTLAGAVSAGVAAGSIVPASSTNGLPPAVPAGKIGEWLQQTKGSTALPAGYGAIVATKAATILGTGETNATVLSSGGLVFHSGGGSGTVVAGGGANRIVIPQAAGDWSINTGAGNDSILALGDGDDTVRAGAGRNVIQLGDGADLVLSEGRDRIVLGAGSATILASGGGCGDDAAQQVWGGSGTLFFVGAGAATVFGGTGSATIHGGDGPNEFRGGSAGNNVMYAGGGRATLFAGGDGDILYAEGSHKQELHGSTGASTLFGALADGNNSFFAGSGVTAITGGWGNDRFVGGAGDSTITGGPGKDIYSFINGLSGGEDLIYGFDSNDRIKLDGYGKHAVANALASQESIPGGVRITLADDTLVTFMGLDKLTKSDFG